MNEELPVSGQQGGKALKFLRQFSLLTIGALLIASGIYFFKIQNHFSTGGLSGLSIVLVKLIGDPRVTEGMIITVFNVLLIVIGRIIVGRDFTFKTIYCTLLVSGATWVFEYLFPMDAPITNQKFLELVFAIFIPSVGSAILFYEGASSGGTDIVAMIIKKFSSINISMALFIADSLIVVSTLFVFDAETFLFCVLGLMSKAFLVNSILESINTSRSCTVITSREYVGTICSFITEKLNKSATVSEAFSSAYLHESKAVIITALTRKQAARLKEYIKSVDSHSFIIVSSTSMIFGKGFKENI